MNNFSAFGRLTRDPEIRTFGATKVANFGIAINGRKKNSATGEWADKPLFLDCKAFGKQADTTERFLRKASQVALVGALDLEEWNDKATGQKRAKISFIVEKITLCGDKPQAGGNSQPRREPAARQPDFDDMPQSGGEDIPF